MTSSHLAPSVGSIMTRSLLTVEADESVLMAYELAERAGVHHLPVMSKDGHCLGVASTDLLRGWSAGPLGPSRPPIGGLIGRRRVEIGPDASLQEAALAMDQNETDAVLVVEDGQLVGLLTWRDVVRWVAGVARPDHASPNTRPVLFSLDPVIELADRD